MNARRNREANAPLVMRALAMAGRALSSMGILLAISPATNASKLNPASRSAAASTAPTVLAAPTANLYRQQRQR